MLHQIDKNKVIVICGPTASGKTALSIELAKRINGEIVSADSMQIYDKMNIGTAKPSLEEMQNIEHHLIGNVQLDRRYSVSEYKIDAENAIKQIIEKGKNPIVVGGTGLYINSLIYGIEYPNIEIDLKYREQLENEVKNNGLESLYNKAKLIDKNAVDRISPNDKKRILRILEIYHQTRKTKTEIEIESRKKGVAYDYKIFAINIDRKILYDRINKRVDEMFNNGIIEETKKLYNEYGEGMITATQAIGYKEVVEYLKGNYNKEDMIEKIKMETRRYAKRQITWFKKIDSIKWLDGTQNLQNNIKVILEEI